MGAFRIRRRWRRRLTREYWGAPAWLIALVPLVLVMLVTALILATANRREVGGTAFTAPPSTPSDERVAAFVGDSYSQGRGASRPEKRWVTLAAAEEGWRGENFGRGGTGYQLTSDINGCGLRV